MKKLSVKQINYFLKDEKKANAEYRRVGLPGLAKDEAKHARFFKMLKAKGR
jgi:hypothetical protein